MADLSDHYTLLQLLFLVIALQCIIIHSAELSFSKSNTHAQRKTHAEAASNLFELPSEAAHKTTDNSMMITQCDHTYLVVPDNAVTYQVEARTEEKQNKWLNNVLNKANSDTSEKYFNTSEATILYRAEHEKGQESHDQNHALESVLLLPTQRDFDDACDTGNLIDDCWRCDSDWQNRRQELAACAVGFGINATGGMNGSIYEVINNEDDTQNPAPGSLRYGVTRDEPLWIIFAQNMTIELKGELILSSYKTIDGRGATVHIVGSSQITIEGISNVIIHGLYIQDIVQSGPAEILTSPSQVVSRGTTDGDAVHVKTARNVWIDHCYLANAYDGLIDCTKNSTFVTISNNYFTNHNKVMLFGASYEDVGDRIMQITVAFNKFGPDLIQRMPRCRFGYCHVANNFYLSGWGQYAIGGSEDPTILSQGNIFNATGAEKEVTKRIDDDGPTYGGWETWNWVSSGDNFLSDAYFTGSGEQNSSSTVYDNARSFTPRSVSMVPAMTASAGPLNCVAGTRCYDDDSQTPTNYKKADTAD